MRKWLRKYRGFVCVALGVAAITGIYGYLEYNRSLPDTRQLRSAFNLKSADLVRQFETDELKATALYAGKVISVQGVIGSVQSTDTSGAVFLNNGSSITSVLCQFDQKNFHEMTELQKGNTITIKGVCSGYLLDVVMVRCIVE